MNLNHCRSAVCMVIIYALSGCGNQLSSSPQSIASPSGKLKIAPVVNETTKCIGFKLVDAQSKVLATVSTDASNYHKWALGWHDDTTIVLSSSDVGTSVWTLNEERNLTKQPTPISATLVKTGEKLRAERYSQK